MRLLVLAWCLVPLAWSLMVKERVPRKHCPNTEDGIHRYNNDYFCTRCGVDVLSDEAWDSQRRTARIDRELKRTAAVTASQMDELIEKGGYFCEECGLPLIVDQQVFEMAPVEDLKLGCLFSCRMDGKSWRERR